MITAPTESWEWGYASVAKPRDRNKWCLRAHWPPSLAETTAPDSVRDPASVSKGTAAEGVSRHPPLAFTYTRERTCAHHAFNTHKILHGLEVQFSSRVLS